jgi:hypothetical protein
MWLTPTSGIRPPEEHTEGYFVPYRHIGFLGCYSLRGRFEDIYTFGLSVQLSTVDLFCLWRINLVSPRPCYRSSGVTSFRTHES